jgi:hypothetical protein
MADLTWSDVLIIGGVATLGFMFLSFWWSGIMSRRGWSWQIKSKPKKRDQKAAAPRNDARA